MSQSFYPPCRVVQDVVDGEPIPRAAPWVHFGDGSAVIDMQLPAGPRTLTLQIGDDLHQTIAGLRTTISIDVTE